MRQRIESHAFVVRQNQRNLRASQWHARLLVDEYDWAAPFISYSSRSDPDDPAALGESGDSPWDLQKVFDVFPRLAERREHRGNELSGGEQQMLAIARALVANPVFLVMDEPTEGLAPALVAEVASLIRRLKEDGTSILLVEQNAAFAVKVADYVHVMSKGQIVHSSTPLALWDNDDLKTQWLGVPGTA
jgi:ABC-type branched-subunit amino acid transport system ATPase component